MSSPTIIFHFKMHSEVVVVIDVAGMFYAQRYRLWLKDRTQFIESEVWSDSDHAIGKAYEWVNQIKGYFNDRD